MLSKFLSEVLVVIVVGDNGLLWTVCLEMVVPVPVPAKTVVVLNVFIVVNIELGDVVDFVIKDFVEVCDNEVVFIKDVEIDDIVFGNGEDCFGTNVVEAERYVNM